jgi:hyaluronoglucosaminidase
MGNKLFGVVEGFYRKPYTFKQRQDMIKFLSDTGLNAYVYAPKEDPFHRKKYRIPYPPRLMKEFVILNGIAERNKVHFIYALSPGARPDPEAIFEKFQRFINEGITKFAILYDDINTKRNPETAGIQAKTANDLYNLLSQKSRSPVVLFCPTQYDGFKPTEYLLTISRELDPRIAMIWTGKRVVSFRITVKHVDRINRLTGRKQLIWDNFFANDYVPPGVLISIPYRYRQAEIVGKTLGILINPMNQYLDSKRAVYTAAKFFNDPRRYEPRQAWRDALKLIK